MCGLKRMSIFLDRDVRVFESERLSEFFKIIRGEKRLWVVRGSEEWVRGVDVRVGEREISGLIKGIKV